MAPSDVLTRVKRAYERPHLHAAIRALVVAALLIVIALGLYRVTRATYLVATVLAATMAVFAWRGGAWRRGALAGVGAGVAPQVQPCHTGARASPRRYALAAIATAALGGLLGCGTTGLGGATGVVLGLVAGGVAGWIVAGRTAHA